MSENNVSRAPTRIKKSASVEESKTAAKPSKKVPQGAQVRRAEHARPELGAKARGLLARG